MPSLTWLNPAGLTRRTGGTLYNRWVVDGLRALGWQIDEVPADRGPMHVEGLTVVDGLIWPELEFSGGPVVVLVHSPLFRERGAPWRERERVALGGADFLVGTSALSLQDLGVQGEVIPPGAHPAPQSTGAGVLNVGHLIPRKGHDLLLRALDLLERPPRVRVAGSAEVHPAHAASLTSDPRVDWLGEVQDLEPEYQRAGLLVHCADFEGWGMALDEARVRGLEIITTEAGSLERHRDHVRVVERDPQQLADAIAAWQDGARWGRDQPLVPSWEDVAEHWHQWLSERTRRL